MHTRNNRSNSNNIQEFVLQPPEHHLELGHRHLVQFALQTNSNHSGLRLHYRHSKREQPWVFNLKLIKVHPSLSSLHQDHHLWEEHRSHRTLESLLAKTYHIDHNLLSPAIRLSSLRHQYLPQNSMEQLDPGYRA